MLFRLVTTQESGIAQFEHGCYLLCYPAVAALDFLCICSFCNPQYLQQELSFPIPTEGCSLKMLSVENTPETQPDATASELHPDGSAISSSG